MQPSKAKLEIPSWKLEWFDIVMVGYMKKKKLVIRKENLHLIVFNESTCKFHKQSFQK